MTIIPLIMPQNEDDNNNVANAQKQNHALRTSFSSNSGINTTTSSAPASISLPLSRGYVNGKIAYFIATDASDNQTALEITNNLKFKVNFAPSLASIPESSRQQGMNS